jgi:signal transduction histidine kinase/NAD-dependent dihydropyrimidine dehydrogenase PreA subunit
MTALVTTIRDRCQRCYGCVHNCPARAIKVEDGQAKVVDERCIGCGNCVRVCTQSAKEIRSDIGVVRALLGSGEPAVAALAPSFPVAFHQHRPGQVISALRRLGFAEVVEVAFGAELVSREYARLHREGRSSLLITTACPAAVTYIEKYIPALVPYLAPIVSPMIAMARVVKQRCRPNARVVFIGPCIAKKGEMDQPEVAGLVDAVLTFRELRDVLAQDGVDLAGLPVSDFDGPIADTARLFPLEGGLTRAARVAEDLLDSEVIVTHGRDSALQLLHELERGAGRARLADVLFCQGCVDGPRIENNLGPFARREILAAYVRARSTPANAERATAALAAYADVDVSRGHVAQPVVLPQPGEKEIRAALARVNKTRPEDELNCGACGYNTCREKAIAVCQGLAESEMCLPYLVDQLQQNYQRLQALHSRLQDTQGQLIQSEKLASMGQLAAGVAHEINNPLGTILLHSHIMLERPLDGRGNDGDHARRLRMIADEAGRCRDIVAGLLNFARQTRLITQLTDLNALLADDLRLLREQPVFSRVEIQTDWDATLPAVEVDPAQLREVFRNLFVNAAESMPAGGTLSVATTRVGDSRVAVQVADTGCGIPKDNLDRVFQPLFTTKELGEGTGLGLAIAYGIVKMHRGQIEVTSEVSIGTIFVVTLPLRLGLTRDGLIADGDE